MLKRTKKLLQNRRLSGKFIVLLMIVILISLWFYWFQWRPAEIRKNCSNLDLKEIEKVLGGKLDVRSGIPNFNKLYRICLAMNGLKPEDLISSE